MVVLNLMVTDACNLACTHCYVDSRAQGDQAKYISTTDVEFILKSFEHEPVELVHVFGGEPFFHPKIRDICEVCRDFGVPVNVATNGTTIEGHLDWLKRGDISLSINMLGEDSKLQDIIGCGYPLDLVVRNARMAVDTGLSVNGICCAFPFGRNAQETSTFYGDYLHGLNEKTNVTEFFLLYFSRLGRGKDLWNRINHEFYRADNWLLFLKTLGHHLEEKNASFHVYVEPAFETELFSFLPPASLQCEMIVRENVVITPDLWAYPCVLMIGNTGERCLKKFDGNVGAIQAYFSDVQSRTITRSANTCRHCVVTNYCGPCVPYVQDKLKDYRCTGNSGTETMMGCPLATVRLW
nr:radical SAM protein [Candidatus Sigynarchaeota archaeon]